MIKRYAKIIGLVIVGLVGCGLTIMQTVRIQNPGATGMVRQMDIDLLKETDAYYLENTDVSSNPGILQRRDALVRANDSNRIVHSATSLMDNYMKLKMIAGVLLTHDSIKLHLDSAVYYNVNPDTVSFQAAYDSFFISYDDSLGKLVVSDTFDLYLMDTSLTHADAKKCYLFGGNRYHDWLSYNNMLIHCDGSGLPTIISIRQYDDSPDPDTIIFQPRLLTLSPPRPGEPRVQVLDHTPSGGNTLNGYYEYCYARRILELSGYGNNWITDTSYHSIIVEVKNQSVLIDCFLEKSPFRADTGAGYIDSLKRGYQIYLFRRELSNLSGYQPDTGSTALKNQWDLVEAFWMKPTDIVSIIDSGQTRGDSTLNDFHRPTGLLSAGMPGSIMPRGEIIARDTLSDIYHFEEEGNYVSMAWSYYDPVTGVESALSKIVGGPGGGGSNYLIVDSTHVAGPDTVWTPRRFSLPYLMPEKCPTDFIRIYRSVRDDDLAGADDFSVLYCLYQISVDRMRSYSEGSMFVLGIVPDSVLLNGPVDFSILSQHYGSKGQAIDSMYDDNDVDSPYGFENETYSPDGELIMRPPIVAPLRIPFKDMEYANGRLWGIGDPLFPQRLYYSGSLEDDGINDWNPLYYLNMDESENDELVAIEKVESAEGDLMLVWKHNSLYVMSGYDPEYDAQIYRIADGYGAVNRFGVIKTSSGVFFMTNEHKIYMTTGAGVPQYISGGLQDYIDSTFIDSIDYKIRTMVLTDRVLFVQTHSTKKRGISINLKGGGLSIETWYSNVVPAGSFLYDTVQGTVGFRDYSYLIYENDADSSYLWYEYEGNADSLNDSTEYLFPVKYQTPFIGDGNYVYAIDRVHFRGEVTADSAVIAQVRNERDSVLTADTMSLTLNVLRDYDFTFPDNFGKYLSVHISGKGLIKINDLVIEYRKIGLADIR